MSTRKSRRAVMAELLLMADPIHIWVRNDGASMAIDFDSVAELRSWLHLAGLNSPDLLTGEAERTDDGRAYRTLDAYPTWHGWEIFAHATEYADTNARLDAATADQLAALAVTP